jgi:peroxiredoxin Q/BCP
MSRRRKTVQRGLWVLILLACLVVASAGSVEAVQVGERAPDFTLPDQHGRLVRLGELLGKQHVVLAFYIQAFTPG